MSVTVVPQCHGSECQSLSCHSAMVQNVSHCPATVPWSRMSVTVLPQCHGSECQSLSCHSAMAQNVSHCPATVSWFRMSVIVLPQCHGSECQSLSCHSVMAQNVSHCPATLPWLRMSSLSCHSAMTQKVRHRLTVPWLSMSVTGLSPWRPRRDWQCHKFLPSVSFHHSLVCPWCSIPSLIDSAVNYRTSVQQLHTPVQCAFSRVPTRQAPFVALTALQGASNLKHPGAGQKVCCTATRHCTVAQTAFMHT